ncbi:MAG: ATP-grasp domain-containing protein [Nitrospirae bacterium]|nr:ATP-grasp domain-containing protein [Nitrospirota bacterium]
MKKLLLLIPTNSYKTGFFLEAAERLGVEVVVGSNRRQILEKYSGGRTVTLNFRNLDKGVDQIVACSKQQPLSAIIATDEETALLAVKASEALSLPHNSIASIYATRDKSRLREILALAGLPSPSFRLFPIDGDPKTFASDVRYPVVLKPLFLSASRGVIRANHQTGFVEAFNRIVKILSDPELYLPGDNAGKFILVEDFIPGIEVALEGLLVDGTLHPLALFDKPDPLDGPFFEETLYVTPSRLPFALQKDIAASTQKAVNAIGLREGPVHAELRVNDKGPWVIEIAARSIGGLCSRTLHFGTGLSLEEVILQHALGLPVESMEREPGAAGVMMIPIPRRGVLREVKGKSRAEQVPGVEEVNIMIRAGQKVVPLPEGHRYLGFIFALGERPEEVEKALRKAHQHLEFAIEPSA